MLEKIICCAAFIATATAFDVEIERPEVEYCDKEVLAFVNATVRRASRKSPYTVTLDTHVLKTVGNNVTINVKLLENLSGRYQPTFVNVESKLCDFLENEPYLGKMLSNQFPPDRKCPFTPGPLHFPSIEVRFDNFPYKLPFTYPFKTISVRLDMDFYVTTTKRTVTKFNFYGKIKLDKK